MRVSQANFKDYESIDLLDVFPPDTLTLDDKNKFSIAIGKLAKIKTLLDKANAVDKDVELPEELSRNLSELKSEFLQIVNSLAVIHAHQNLPTQEILTKHDTSIRETDFLYRKWFDSGSDTRVLMTIMSILSFDDPDLVSYKKKYDFRFKELDEAIETAKRLNKEYEEKAAKSVVSNYAKIFESEETKNKTNSVIWLSISIGTSIIFISLLVLSFTHDWFKLSEKIMTNEGEKIVLNVPNLVSKLFVVSFSIFIISFFFKQYSINRNLQTLNNHRKNALNSYTLFVESIGKEDMASRNALMLQVAKAIYEHSSSGYLSAKQSDNSTPNFIEFTKFISDKS